MAAVKIDNMANAIAQVLSEYTDEVAEVLKEDVKEVAKECASNIKTNSPSDSGNYKKGWKTKVAFENKNNIRVEVYNAKKPQLTHLLEYGHAKVNGGRVEGHPHIRPAEEMAEKALLKRAEEAAQ